MQSGTHTYFNSIIDSGEEIYSLAKTLEINEVEKKLPDYIRNIKKYFDGLNRDKLTVDDLDDVKQIMSVHKKIINLINQEKEKISKNIKQLHTGNQMRNTYPNKS